MRMALFYIFMCWSCLMPLYVSAQEETTQEIQDSGFISKLIADNLSGISRDVVISGFDGALSARATIRVLTVADDGGVWLRMEGLTLDWDRAALLRGQIEIAELSADQITILRAPVSSSSLPNPEARAFSLPDLPVAVNIGALRANRIVLGAAVLGEAVEVRLTGRVNLANGEGSAVVQADRTDGKPGRFAIDASYSNASRILGLDLDLTEANDGIVARLLDLRGRPAVRLQLTGTAPIDDYAANLNLATDGQDRVVGQMALRSVPAGDGGQSGRAYRLNLQGDVTPLVPLEYGAFFGSTGQILIEAEQDADGTTRLSALDIKTAALTLNGSGAFSPDGWPTRFALTGQIGASGAVPVVLPFVGRDTSVEKILLDVRFDAAANDGWTGKFAITNLFQDGLSVADLTLDGAGTILQATELSTGQFTAALTYAADGITLNDPALANAVGPALSGEVNLSRDNDGPLRFSGLTLRGPGIEADAQGEIAGPAEGFAIDSTLQLNAADAARFDLLTGLDLGGAAKVLLTSTLRPLDGIFDLVLVGQTTDLTLGIATLDPLLSGIGTLELTASRDTAGTRITDLNLRTPAMEATGQADLTNEASAAQFDLKIADVGVALPNLRGPAHLTGTASRNIAGAIAVDVSAAIPGGDAIFSLAKPNAAITTPYATELFVDFPDLTRFSGLTGLSMDGILKAGLNGNVQSDFGQFDLTLTGQTTDIAVGISPVDQLLKGSGRIAGQITGSGLANMQLTNLDLQWPGLTGSANAGLTEGDVSTDFSLTTRFPDLVMPGFTGPAVLTGQANRSASGDWALDANAGLMGIDAILTLSQSDNAPIRTEVFASLPDLSSLDSLTGQAMAGQINIGATGTVSTDLTDIDLTLGGNTRDLRIGLPQVDPLFAGSGTLSGRIVRDSPTNFRIENAALRTEAAAALMSGGLRDGNAQVDFDLSLPQISVIAPTLDGAAQVNGTASRDNSGTINLDLNATGPGAQLQLLANSTTGDAQIDTDLSISFSNLAPYARLLGQDISGSVDATIRGTLAPDASIFDLTLAAQTRDLDPGDATAATLLRGTGNIDAHLQRDERGGLRIDRFDVRYPNLTLSGALDGRGGAGTAQFSGQIADIGLFTPEFSGPVTALGTAQRDRAGNWQVDTDVTGPGGTNAVIAGQIGATGRLDLTAKGRAPLGIANAVIAPRRIEGDLGFDLALRGQPQVAALSGTLQLSDARLTDPTLAKAVRAIGGTITLALGQAQVDLSGTLEDGGNLSLAGAVNLASPFQADLQVGLDQLVLRDPLLYETKATGTIDVTGPLAGGALISGLIDLGTTELQVPSSGVSALGDLPQVRHVNAPGPVLLTLDRAGLSNQGGNVRTGTGGPVYSLDLTIRAPSKVFIRGRGLDAELAGQIVLGGTTAQIIPSGQLDLVRGRISILQQRFDLTDGSLTLEGDFSPMIRLVAQTTARTGTVISIALEGPISEPVVNFTSAPELPQDEVLAQLLFGQDLRTISPLQAVQLAAAVGTLAGRGGGGLIEGFRTGLGVDDFDITSDAEGNTALRVGKYIDDNLYTDVTISSGTTELNLNLDLSEDVTVKGSVSSDGETGLGIFFEQDY